MNQESEIQSGSSKHPLPIFVNGAAGLLNTYLYIKPATTNHSSSFFASLLFFSESESVQSESPYSNRSYARHFAGRLQSFPRFSSKNMKEFGLRAGILTLGLKHSMDSVYDFCTTCKSNGCPLNSNKLLFRKLLAHALTTCKSTTCSSEIWVMFSYCKWYIVLQGIPSHP